MYLQDQKLNCDQTPFFIYIYSLLSRFMTQKSEASFTTTFHSVRKLYVFAGERCASEGFPHHGPERGPRNGHDFPRGTRWTTRVALSPIPWSRLGKNDLAVPQLNFSFKTNKTLSVAFVFTYFCFDLFCSVLRTTQTGCYRFLVRGKVARWRSGAVFMEQPLPKPILWWNLKWMKRVNSFRYMFACSLLRRFRNICEKNCIMQLQFLFLFISSRK